MQNIHIAPASETLAFEALDSQTSGTQNPPQVYTSALAADAVHFVSDIQNDVVHEYSEIRSAGRAFGLFILAERGDRLYLIDQHAAHERILYDRFLSGHIPKQDLLVPMVFTAGSAEDDDFLEEKQEELARLSIILARDGNGWRIDALPAGWKMGDADTVREILELRNARENIAERWAATLCCHQAVRDGDYLDDKTALSLAKDALALPDPRCPHGRPVWTVISRDALLRAVRRK
jgi:DNA mismatch repair protein MutL